MARPQMTLDDVRTKVKTFRPRYKSLPSMSQLKITDPSILEVDGKSMPMTEDAIRGLCHELDMPANFFMRLHQKKKEAWERLVRAMQDQRKPVTLIASDTAIIAVVSHIGEVTKHSEVLDTAEILLRNKNFSLRSADFTGIELRLHIMKKEEIDVGGWSENKEDKLFRQGVVLKNNIVHGFEAKSAFEQLICTNLAYCEIPNTEKRINDIEKVPDFLFRRVFRDIGEWLKRRVMGLRKTNMSLEEVISVAKLFGSETRFFMKEYLSQLRLAEISNAYRMTSDQILEMPEMWRATVKTPFICYDIMSWLSYIARHDHRLDNHEIMQFRIKSGRILTDVPHLASIAEQKVISKTPWILTET